MRKINTVRDLKGEVRRIIREGITSRSLPPGMQLKESDLVEKLGVSRTPIREALNQLSKEGIVEILPRKGAFVKRWTKEEIIEDLILHEVLEGLAARLATTQMTEEDIHGLEETLNNFNEEIDDYAHIDEQFHSRIIQACGSAKLISMIKNLNDGFEMLDMRSVIFMFRGRIEDSIAEHRRIIEAFRSRDENMAEKTTKEHFKVTSGYYINQLKRK